ncbi:MAG: zf-HC2 domain-containing protein [Acidobacteria bacterium]|nr:zf-HC2 domain-containing protein [Acidobacteriota bacterium]
MKCESLQFDLPLYLDDALSEDECIPIGEHLKACPLCRLKLDEFRTIKNELRRMPAPVMPAGLLQSVRNAVASELSAPSVNNINLGPLPTKSLRELINHWLMPYSVGTISALFLTFLLLSNLGNTRIAADEIALNENPALERTTLLTNSGSENTAGGDPAREDYTRVALDGNTPRVNPAGALLALTRSIVRGEMKDEEVVVVADVFSDGIARINQVVKAPSDEKSMRELERAFRTDPEKAPFLPPVLENNSKSVRVILKIQRVDVAVPAPKKRVNEKFSS